ncbi:MAG: hypothetical protein ACFFBD_16575, partial [Candidatus Hodarchaeota archaeon]
MIKQITLETLDNLTDVIADYVQFLNEEYGRPIFPMKEQIRETLVQKTRNIFALYNQENFAIGFVIADSQDGWIRAIHVENPNKEKSDTEIETYKKMLFDTAFNHLKASCPYIRLWGPNFPDELTDYIIKAGFQEFKRARMFIEMTSIEALPEPELSSEYNFDLWDKDTSSIIEVLMSHFSGTHPDATVFLHFAGVDGSTRLTEELKVNRYGQFK